jgi:hypothetical protein
MPLIKGPRARTKPGMAANIKAESKTKPRRQAIAIALSLAGKSKKTKKK